jgi:hypothetical protein
MDERVRVEDRPRVIGAAVIEGDDEIGESRRCGEVRRKVGRGVAGGEQRYDRGSPHTAIVSVHLFARFGVPSALDA